MTIFQNINALIIGDVMIDHYTYGKVQRISPEAPVPVVEYQKQDFRLGGAANVALNIQALGATPYLFSVIGSDTEGGQFLDILKKQGLPTQGILQNGSRLTTLKTRIMVGSHQMLRLDKEITTELSAELEQAFIAHIRQFLETQPIQVIIFQDYNKGVLTLSVIQAILALAQIKQIPTAVDPKFKHFLDYQNATLFKPNLKEIKDAMASLSASEIPPLSIKPDIKALTDAAEFLHHKLGNRYTMITLSENGLFLHDAVVKKNTQIGEISDTPTPATKPSEMGKIYPTQARHIADVSGAGDTVISVAALCLAVGSDNETLAILSNLAGGQVCEKAGVVPVNLAQLETEWHRLSGL
jgi:rfaE bifunctional protein kinase chain/domain